MPDELNTTIAEARDRAITDRLMGSKFRHSLPVVAMACDELVATMRREERQRCVIICCGIAERNYQESASDSARRCAQEIEHA